MTDMTEAEAVRIVAEFDGWKNVGNDYYQPLGGGMRFLISFSELNSRINSRDALIEVAKKLSTNQQSQFVRILAISVCPNRSVFQWPEIAWAVLACPASTLLLCLAQTIKEGKSL